ncbi:nucleoside phosphorylase [Haloquadratum walsbyi]|jgi:Uridine phosphorylase|uniref:Uridine phosphorylase n=1 Tax=Haloquadratum walsbyi J07HQW2 TaxID=1238425 RepID=U1NDL9_9EURY|nr:nucleoside phosphorylase [Haloquadratum walsbyi]ERG94838.1 MAG: uridine phosphorylase [Haloquadratum walsbyi J07HQW2]
MDDSEDPNDDEQYHLEITANDIADTVLLPGNPGRVETITEIWDQATVYGDHREFRTATGTYQETPISVTSTGIGGPSAAIAIEELARIGAETFIRVGSCGALSADVAVGDLIISSGAIRQEGTSAEYVRDDYPAVADYEVISALTAAAEQLGHDYHVGVTLSTDSFYPGQDRPGFNGYTAPGSGSLIEELKQLNVMNIEMEAATLLTIASLYQLRAGAICTVYANRETGEFQSGDDTKAAETATLGCHLLAEMDAAKRSAGVDQWHAGLSIESE